MEYLAQMTSTAIAWSLTATLCLSLLTPQETSEWIRTIDEVQTTLADYFEETIPNELAVSRRWEPIVDFVCAVDYNRGDQKETTLLSNAYPRYLRFRSLLI
jgi:hypothetical protein